MKVTNLVSKENDYITGLRRHFHKHPELSLQESATAAKIREELTAIGIDFVNVGEHGIVATIEGTRTDRVVALRADMDALPIVEENDHLDYCSINNGVMHACGHDGHIAMLLGAAKVFSQIKDQIHGTVKLCFQQAEETGHGTKEILEELKKFPVKTVFGIHLWSEIETGKISVESGPRMAAGQAVEIVIHGVGTHGASPNKGVDPIMAASAVVMNLSALISREVPPVHPTVLTFGQIQGGGMGNIIPEKVVLKGSLRNTNADTQKYIIGAIERMAKTTAEAYRAKADVTITKGVPIVYNDPKCSSIATQAAVEVAGKENVILFDTLMASENYADFLAVYPGILAFIGVRCDSCGAVHPHHHPKFNIDENQLAVGTALHVQYTLDYFNSGE